MIKVAHHEGIGDEGEKKPDMPDQDLTFETPQEHLVYSLLEGLGIQGGIVGSAHKIIDVLKGSVQFSSENDPRRDIDINAAREVLAMMQAAKEDAEDYAQTFGIAVPEVFKQFEKEIGLLADHLPKEV